MTAAELIALLQQMPPKTPIELAYDDEANLPVIYAEHPNGRRYALTDGDEAWS